MCTAYSGINARCSYCPPFCNGKTGGRSAMWLDEPCVKSGAWAPWAAPLPPPITCHLLTVLSVCFYCTVTERAKLQLCDYSAAPHARAILAHFGSSSHARALPAFALMQFLWTPKDCVKCNLEAIVCAEYGGSRDDYTGLQTCVC